MNPKTIKRQHAAEALQYLREFINPQQRQVLRQLCQGEEAEFFHGKLVSLAELIQKMPATYQTEGQGEGVTVWLHYFKGGADFFIYEKDMLPEQNQAFGLADFYRDGGELGYISIIELMENGVELDLYWTPKTLAEVRAERETRLEISEPVAA